MARDEYKGLTADTKRLLAGAEGREIDFKRNSSGVKAEDFVAFSNSQGGCILIGVDEEELDDGSQRGIVVGCTISDETRLALNNIAASCRPSIHIRIQTENTRTKKPIYRVDIPEGDEKPYCTSSGVYKVRIDGQNIGIDPTLMKAIILDREAEQFVSRFRAAGDELLATIRQVHTDLAAQIDRVERVAAVAEQSAFEAREAAEQAASAAEDAAMFAEDSGGW